MSESEVKSGKTVGIACDNYKLKRYEEELKKAGFTDYEVTVFSAGVKFISVKNVPADRVHDVHKICIKLETDFKRRN